MSGEFLEKTRESAGRPEDFEVFEKRVGQAQKLIDEFLGVRREEKVLFVTDRNEFNTDPELIRVLGEALERKGIEYGVFEADKKTPKQKLFEKIKQHDVVWDSWDMNTEGADYFYELTEILSEFKKRMAWCPGVRAESLDSDGALAEDRGAIEYRLNKMEEKLRDVEGFHVRSSYGTDLWVQMRPKERRWYKDSGVIEPGKWDNLPGGEIFTTPDEEKVNGMLVLPVLQGEVTQHQGVDALVRLKIKNGRIATIDGGESAEILRRYLEKNSADQKDPRSVLQCAEIAFGANSKARSVVSDSRGDFTDLTHPTTETEKRLGTMHIAFGSTKHGEEGTEGHTESDEHLDFVIPRNGLTVTAFMNHRDFQNRKNGRRLIDEGRWLFLE